MAEKIIDGILKNKVVELAKKQQEIATDILKHKTSPNGLNEVGKYCKEIFVAGTEEQARYDIKLGSWIADQFLPLQLLTQRKLMVDLTIDELKKQKPYNIPLKSLIKLVRQGLIYLNIRDFDILKDEENNKLFTNDKVTQNLSYIMDKVPNYCLYVGSAMRKPLFDGLTHWDGYTNSSYEDKQKEFIEKVSDAATAYEFYSYKESYDRFRGEDPSLIAASWHYAYLSAAKSKIDNIIFNDENGIDTQIDKCQIFGSVWSKDKNNADKKAKAKDVFVQLTKCLRSFHLNNTALLTGSWGHIYNRTFDEYKALIDIEAKMFKPNITKDINYQNFFYSVLQESGIIKNEISYNSLIDPVNTGISIDESFTDTLIESLLNKGSLYDEIDEITKELCTIDQENFTRVTYDKLLKEYNRTKNNFLSHFDRFFSDQFKVELSLGNSIINILPISLKVEISKFSLPEDVKKLLIREKKNLLMYRLHHVITKNKPKK